MRLYAAQTNSKNFLKGKPRNESLVQQWVGRYRVALAVRSGQRMVLPARQRGQLFKRDAAGESPAGGGYAQGVDAGGQAAGD